jgi:predicted TIM-barrel fold metal-dependent hydrolase
MVIDCHTHMVRYESFTPGYRRFLENYRPDYFGAFMERYDNPANVDAMLEAAGVERAVVMAEPTPLTTGMASTEYVVDFCRRSRRLIPFASFDPFLTPNLPEELERAVKELGCRGLKLYPSYQYFAPNDAKLYPLYAKAQDLDIPVTFHTGSSVFPGARLKWADPLLLDDLATDFPRLRVLMAHGGRPFWYDRAAFLARLHPNFYLELSGLPPRKLLTYFPELERIADKTLFATDWPALPTDIDQNIADFSALPLSDRAKRLILEENARRVLQL